MSSSRPDSRAPGFWPGAFLLVASLFSLSSASAPTQWMEKADSLKLWESRQWRDLLHFRASASESDIDGGFFFLSNTGKQDPRAEMDATITALLTTENTAIHLATDSSMVMHPQVRYPARMRFLKERLGIPDSAFPYVDRSRFERWYKVLEPDEVSMVFASSYLGNPASVMGHSFLRLHSHRNSGAREILDYGVNYAAQVPPNEGFAFTFKGVLGMYPGTYGLLPYYVSLQKYANIESRDLWEYRLHLSHEERRRLLEHLWELGNVWMSYWFFSENCSYNMSMLLQASLDSGDVVSPLNGTVFPIETIRVLRQSGRIDSVVYRPSLMTTVGARSRALPPHQKQLLQKISAPEKTDAEALGELRLLPAQEQAQVLDVSLDYVQNRKRNVKTAAWANLQDTLLAIRRANSNLPEAYSIAPGNRLPPDRVHLPHRFVGGPLLSDWHVGADMEFRFAYQDLIDPTDGEDPGFFLEFGRVRARIQSNNQFRIEEANLIDLRSLSSQRAIYRPLVWRVTVAMDRPRIGDDPGSPSLHGDGALGATTGLRSKTMLFALAGARVRAMSGLEYCSAAGPLLWSGFRYSPSSWAALVLQGEWWQAMGWNWDREGTLRADLRLGSAHPGYWLISAVHTNGVGEGRLAWAQFF